VPPNIRDVARAASVSITTVSHALNGKGRVSEETRQRVLRAADELGYTANVHARGLVTGRALTLAVQISGFGRQTFVPGSAYFTELLNGAYAMALDLGYVLVLIPSAAEADLNRMPADGALVVDPTGHEALMELMRASGAPVVTTGRVPSNEQLSDGWVDNDHPAAAHAALEHLRQRGYVRPALLTTARELSYSLDAQEAYARWAGERGQEPIVGTIEGELDVDEAAEVTASLLRREPAPDALYSTNDAAALGALRAVRAAGLSVPGDVGIVGEMDTEALRLADPPLTAIDVMPAQLGREAVGLLVGLVEGADVARRRIVVETELIPRTSSAGPATPA
jgi:DNA-binding LacI/PurR family transcriptional regulator